MSSSLPYWLAALYLPKIKPGQFLEALSHFSNIENLFVADSATLKEVGFNESSITALQKPNWQQVDKDLVWQNRADRHIVCMDDPAYPPLLREIADPPLLLFVSGNKKILSQEQLAIVGSRHPTTGGILNARHFAKALLEYGVIVTSGLAMGIDGAAHQSVVSHNGKTIAVLGTGLNSIYPAIHTKLAQEILENHGALISEFPLSTPPKGYNFPRRNRIITGLSAGILIVEATLKSGSLVSARLALEQGREVFAIPGNIHQPQYKGCHYLLRDGAILVESIDDIMALFPTKSSPLSSKNHNKINTLPATLTRREQAIYEQIGYETTSLDMIISRSGLTAGELSSILLSLEMASLIHVVPGGYVREITRNPNQVR